MPETVTLSFVNRTSGAASASMTVEAGATADIARWYGAYCAGDDYDVFVDGDVVDKDVNGAID
ncbi:hypothetical protein [Sphingomonas sp. 3-13AW]|uniref:hypothetical protein n=1 Tax=Sphingomonas sp. 3-13AW TaxID=3050450 RepID=UPI003BB4A5FC